MIDTHVPGHTTATASREVRDFTAPTHVHNLEAEVDGLLEEAEANSSHRAAKTLSKDASLNVVLMAIRGGAEVREEHTHGAALLQVIRGHLRVHLAETEVDLRGGEAMSFAGGVPHRLTAVENTAVLLVIAGA